MIRKLQLKFVAICMALVTVILTVVVAFSLFSIQQNISNLSRQVLHRVIREEGPVLPDAGISIGGSQTVLLPYFTVQLFSYGGTYTAYVTGGTYSGLDDTEELAAILRACLDQKPSEGVLGGFHLRYLRQDNGFVQRLAFVDMSMERAILRKTLGSQLAIAAGALGLFLAVSILLARWATAPVERSWKRQRQFLSDASHELKTPLTVILSNAELLESAGLADKPARWAGSIRSEARRMKQLVEEMLTLARAENAARPAPPENLSLSELLVDCVLAFEPVAFEAGKALEYEIAEDIRISGHGDQLRQLAGILLDNAVKYGAEGAPIRLTLRAADRHALLSVSNQGAPIPPEQLEHLFERFYRADVSRGETAGFGLGLAIAKTIAETHRGAIRAESAGGRTSFTCSLPLRRG